MGRWLLVIGVVLIFGGMIGFAATIALSMGGVVENVLQEPEAADLCEPGETLEIVEGASEYTPGTGYARPVNYFCINSEGQRRNVTVDFVYNLFGDNLIPFLGFNLVFIGLSCVGMLLAGIGLMLVILRRSQSAEPHTVTIPRP